MSPAGCKLRGMTDVRLRPWAADDHSLLVATNAPEMTEHLGGPETEEKLRELHERYLLDANQMFVVELAGETVGSIGYWPREWQGEDVYETGWGILPAYQGRGLAVAAATVLVQVGRRDGDRRWLHAYPSAEHPASNAVCRKAGFTLVGPISFEYPRGTWLTSNGWRIDLHADVG